VEASRGSSIHIQLLGQAAVRRSDAAVVLPTSRKVRALLTYLTLAPRPVLRSQLCELLWDIPNDPRGELRWCLSKIRGIVDERGHARVHTRDDTIWLDLSDCFVDALEIAGAVAAGIPSLSLERQRELLLLFSGDLLEGLEIDRSPAFTGWLTAQRRRFRGWQVALLEHLVQRVPEAEAFAHLEKWVQLEPFDLHVHERLLSALARSGRIREGEEHLAATVRAFESDGLECASLRQAWRAARMQVLGPPPPISNADGSVAAARRASIAVMPFADLSAGERERGGTADALAHDVITRLAKLRSLFVIAQGTVFALHDRHIGAEEAGRMLNVDYVVSGSVRRGEQQLAVNVELAETRTARIVWAEIFNHRPDDAFVVLEVLGNQIVASIEHEIETIERNRAILRPPNSLDAWEAHHRGLWHMYLFHKDDNERAQRFFATAVHLDPTFARAYAGLSFTHFQNAFQGWGERAAEIDRAFEAAGRSLMVDDRDPAAHWAMGRALWLRGLHDQCIVELELAIDLSPNFALGHYTLAFVLAQAGDPLAAIRYSDHSRQLSPFDPLLFGMLGARSLALMRLSRFGEAAEWGVKAAARPNAHPHIHAIAACNLALIGALDEARAHVAAIRRTLPHYTAEDLLLAFHLDENGVALIREGARRIDFV
jgi:DNA-binding SARP family transcriptional activator